MASKGSSTLRIVACIVAIVLLCASIPVIQGLKAREKLARIHFLQVGLALSMYEVTHQKFPPAYSVDATGKPLLSWRVAILPFMEEYDLYKQFKRDEPWDSPHNKALIEKMPRSYRSPYARNRTATNVVAIVGPDTAWPAPAASGAKDFESPDKAILVVEYAGDDIPWTCPRDLDASDISYAVNEASKKGISGFGKGAYALLMDGRPIILDKSTSPDEIKAKVNAKKRK